MASGALRNGSHWQGPLLARNDADGGVFENVPLGYVDRVRSRYKCFLENFDYPVALVATGLTGTGATITDINTATVPLLSVTSAEGFLLIDPGTKADSGTEIQWNAAVSQATYLTPATRVLGPIVSTATLMDNRELLFATRVGFRSDTTAWDGKVLLGWFTTDTTLMVNTTGVPSVATGGGIGFHVGETGVMTFLGAQTAITAVGTSAGVNILALDAAATMQWFDLGFRARWLDASAGTGQITYYVNGRNVGSITTDLPMASTETYGVTYAIQNGPARDVDLAVEYIFTAITRPGHTNTSTAGA